MQPSFYAGSILIALGMITFVIEGRDLHGFGQLLAWLRITLLLIGVALVAIGLITKTNAAEQDASCNPLPAAVFRHFSVV